jgi:hypothetical protein
MMHGTVILVGVLGFNLLLCMFLILWKVPKKQASGVQDIKDRLTVENAARQTLAQIIGGAVLIAGLFFTWANPKNCPGNCHEKSGDSNVQSGYC